MNDISDNVLLYYARQNNEAALRYLLEKHRKNLIFCIRRVLRELNYECHCEYDFNCFMLVANLGLYDSIFRFNSLKDANFQTFMLSCVANKIREEVRKSRSKSNIEYNNALRLDDKVMEDEEMYQIDRVQNTHPEFEGKFCMSTSNVEFILELLSENFKENQLLVYYDYVQGYNMVQIANRHHVGVKNVKRTINNVTNFLSDTLTKKN